MKLCDIFTTYSDFKSYINTRVDEVGELVENYLDAETFSLYKIFLANGIYEFYYDNEIAYETETTFLRRFKYTLFETFFKNYSYFNNAFKVLYTGELKNKGNLKTNRDVKLDQQTGSFTKQANTPTAINPSSEFVDSYTDYQSNTDRNFKTDDNYKTTITRDYGNIEVLELFRKLPRSLTDDIINDYKIHFLIVYEGEY